MTTQTTVRKNKAKTEDVAQTPRRPAYFLTLLPDGTAIGWDQCGACTVATKYPVSIEVCQCSKPTPPAYVTNMVARETREQQAKDAEAKDKVKDTKNTVPDDTATEVENPDEALVEAAEGLVEETK